MTTAEKKTVMKRAIQKAARNNYYKWTPTATGLKWGYLETVFEMVENPDGCPGIEFIDQDTGVRASVFITDMEFLIDGYDFVSSYEDALFRAAYKIIRKAEYLY